MSGRTIYETPESCKRMLVTSPSVHKMICHFEFEKAVFKHTVTGTGDMNGVTLSDLMSVFDGIRTGLPFRHWEGRCLWALVEGSELWVQEENCGWHGLRMYYAARFPRATNRAMKGART